MTASPSFDRRLTPWREDLAAERLRGVLEAPAYAAPVRKIAAAPVLDLRPAPDPARALDTQVLFGEALDVYEEKEGWAWVQLAGDSYVGYVRAEGLADWPGAPTHEIRAQAAHVYSRPDIKSPRAARLPMGARLRARGREGDFLATEAGYVFAAHARAFAQEAAPDPDRDFAAVAEGFLETPYLWGGRSADGIDCSGLVQVALGACGFAAPRDADMQQAALGAPVDPEGPLRRGDLVYWKGHVGLLIDDATLLHANAFHMKVAREPFSRARARIAANGAPVVAVKRLAPRA